MTPASNRTTQPLRQRHLLRTRIPTSAGRDRDRRVNPPMLNRRVKIVKRTVGDRGGNFGRCTEMVVPLIDHDCATRFLAEPISVSLSSGVVVRGSTTSALMPSVASCSAASSAINAATRRHQHNVAAGSLDIRLTKRNQIFSFRHFAF